MFIAEMIQSCLSEHKAVIIEDAQGDHEHLLHISGEAFRALLKGVRHGHFSHR